MNNYPDITYKTFPELLLERTKDHPGKTALLLLDDNGDEKEKVTYSRLLNRVSYHAEELKKISNKQDTCLLLLSPGADFLTAFLSCLYAGVIAVPVNLPGRNKRNKRFWSVFEDANTACIITDTYTQKLLDKHFSEEEKISSVPKLMITDQIKESMPDVSVSTDDIAYLQYTSGSTGRPRGVMISHGNLMSNSEIIKQSFQHNETLTGVNWLPHFHDMGLVGTLMQPLYVGGSSIIMYPATFLKNPIVWFRSIQKYKAGTIGCPNFALDYASEKISSEEVKSLDLSSVKVLFCGAEPIRSQSLLRFEEKFKEAGFKRKMFLPCYGLAESTLMVSGISAGEEPVFLNISHKELNELHRVSLASDDDKDILGAVSCGYAWQGTEIYITASGDNEILPEGEIGEIMVSGSSVSKGYWKNDEETELTFKGTIKNKKGYFLKTGDIGFMYKNHLYITGRSKDLIIIRGVNHYPHLIETTVENSHEALQQNACAAFSADVEGEERLIIVAEIKRTFIRELPADEIVQKIIHAVSNEHGIYPFSIVLISTGSIAKTSSGKIIRGECRKLWQNRQLNSLHLWQQSIKQGNMSANKKSPESLDDITQWLAGWISGKTGTDPNQIDLNKPITSYGLDSIAAVELEREFYKNFRIRISISDFLENKAITQILNGSKKDEN